MDGGAVVTTFSLETTVIEHLFRLRKDSVLKAVFTMSHCLVHVSGC